jgi:hypothetical protein
MLRPPEPITGPRDPEEFSESFGRVERLVDKCSDVRASLWDKEVSIQRHEKRRGHSGRLHPIGVTVITNLLKASDR